MVALCGRCLVQHYDGMFHRKFNGRSVRNFRDDLWWQLSIEHHKQHSVIHRITGLEPSRVKRVQNTITLHEELWSWLQRHLLIPFICQWIPANCCQESLHFRLYMGLDLHNPPQRKCTFKLPWPMNTSSLIVRVNRVHGSTPSAQHLILGLGWSSTTVQAIAIRVHTTLSGWDLAE